MNDFNEARLLDKISYGSTFGREFNTRIVSLRSGVDRRNADWQAPLGRYSLLYEVIEPDDQHLIVQAHAACLGALIGFRFKDWSDFEAEDEYIGTGDGTLKTYQLQKSYSFGSFEYNRIISKPVQGTVKVYANGAQVFPVIDYTTGTFESAPAVGQVLTWTGEFDVPVRFEDDRLDVDPIVRRGDGRYVLQANVDLTEIRL